MGVDVQVIWSRGTQYIFAQQFIHVLNRCQSVTFVVLTRIPARLTHESKLRRFDRLTCFHISQNIFFHNLHNLGILHIQVALVVNERIDLFPLFICEMKVFHHPFSQQLFVLLSHCWDAPFVPVQLVVKVANK